MRARSPVPIAATSWSKSLMSYWWFGVSNCGDAADEVLGVGPDRCAASRRVVPPGRSAASGGAGWRSTRSTRTARGGGCSRPCSRTGLCRRRGASPTPTGWTALQMPWLVECGTVLLKPAVANSSGTKVAVDWPAWPRSPPRVGEGRGRPEAALEPAPRQAGGVELVADVGAGERDGVAGRAVVPVGLGVARQREPAVCRRA